MYMKQSPIRMRVIGIVAGGAVIVIAIGYGVFLYALRGQALDVYEEQVSYLETISNAYKETLEQYRQKNNDLNANLMSEQNRNSEFANQIKDISSTVGLLDKLSKTDKELLKKYSKVYFLNENYIPEKLSQIPSSYRYNKDKDTYFHTNALPFLTQMMDAAKKDGIELFVVSAYRSFDTQGGVKSSYTVRYGSGSNSFSADQGYSEHQLGTTVDVTTRDVGAGLTGFDTTDAYAWMKQNAYLYGFILSYPKGNEYYVYEPWHWRFVGVELAKRLHEDGIYFYDADQRQIDSYLISIFD